MALDKSNEGWTGHVMQKCRVRMMLGELIKIDIFKYNNYLGLFFIKI